MPAGFLYVLINPAIPSLAKVGKTTRNPAERVAELSSATGVPSPFILAFQQPVAECDAAELWVHKELEREGYRHADNREFFNAPLHEIIKVVSQAASLVFDTSSLDETADKPIANESSSEDLAVKLFNMGYAYEQGTDSILRNPKKALELYEQAAALGNTLACECAASIYQNGDGVRQNLEKALELYTKAVRLGQWENEAAIAEIFLESQQEDASQVHWKLFFEEACKQIERSPDALRTSTIGSIGYRYCFHVIRGKLAHGVPDKAIARSASLILKRVDENEKKYPAFAQQVRQFVEERVMAA